MSKSFLLKELKTKRIDPACDFNLQHGDKIIVYSGLFHGRDTVYLDTDKEGTLFRIIGGFRGGSTYFYYKVELMAFSAKIQRSDSLYLYKDSNRKSAPKLHFVKVKI